MLNRYLDRLAQSVALALIIIGGLAGPGRPSLTAWFQSPVSPLLPWSDPFYQPTVTPQAAISVSRWMADFWSSPWPWFGIGLVLFGGLVWGLARRLDKRP